MQAGDRLSHKVLRWMDRTLIVIASLGLMAMMVHITVDVLGGLLFNSPLPLTSVYVTQYYMIAVAFLPVFITEYRGGHISVDMFVRYIPAGPRRVIARVIQALFVVVYLMLALQSWQQYAAKLATNAYVMEQTSRVFVWPSFLMLPVAFGLVALLLAAKLAADIMGQPIPAAEPSAADDVSDEEVSHV
jgi:TRAP-type C4-dicarboxylate transport system permease small subunit